ncbi:agmatinase [Pseudodesulfovibrio sp. zrk46]|uniref:agmatinase n=1 Tax=Pseudodesulfovibrio sp. zrk46 TaxID=2725288 RepID=UPI0014492773|nr:agmatinase [Pseudodesulfovibrio sp. zrk46]QJB56863.1 agmatinase [Pseudodesulfovibrio sp. zrk46]
MTAELTVTLLGIPYDEQSSYMQGAAEGPTALLEAYRCDSANMWSETGFDLNLHVEDGGLMTMGTDTAVTDIEEGARKLVASGRKGLFLGGDHSVTYPLVKGLADSVEPFAVLHFDAHPDCYDNFEGNKLSHACPMARIMEEGLCKRLMSVGIRTANGHQREQKEKLGLEWLEMKDFASWPKLSFDTPVYVTVDMDALDPAFAPGVSHHEPGGMTTRQLLDMIHAIDAPVIGADVVELNPRRDINGVTAMTAAKIVKELAGMMIR